jgi:transposase
MRLAALEATEPPAAVRNPGHRVAFVGVDPKLNGRRGWRVRRSSVSSPGPRWQDRARPGGGQAEPVDHAIGRSRGGTTTKIHLPCDGHGRPLSVVLTGGNVNDCTMFEQVMAGICIPRHPRRWPDRPWRRPVRVLADKGYSSRAIRAYLRRRSIAATIPERRDQQAGRLRRGSRGGRPQAFDPLIYRRRNLGRSGGRGAGVHAARRTSRDLTEMARSSPRSCAYLVRHRPGPATSQVANNAPPMPATYSGVTPSTRPDRWPKNRVGPGTGIWPLTCEN